MNCASSTSRQITHLTLHFPSCTRGTILSITDALYFNLSCVESESPDHQKPRAVRSLNMKDDAGSIAGWPDIPPYVTRVAPDLYDTRIQAFGKTLQPTNPHHLGH